MSDYFYSLYGIVVIHGMNSIYWYAKRPGMWGVMDALEFVQKLANEDNQ